MEISYKNFKVETCAGQKVVGGEAMPIVPQPPEHNKSDTESLVSALKQKKMIFFTIMIFFSVFSFKKKPKTPANIRAGRSQALGCVRGD